MDQQSSGNQPAKPVSLVPTTKSLPPEVRNSPVVRRKKITKRALASYQASMLVAHAPALIPAWFEQLYKQVQEGDQNAMQMIAKIYNYIQSGPGVTINNNLMQNNVSQQSGRGFDNIVRMLAEHRDSRAPIDITPEN